MRRRLACLAVRPCVRMIFHSSWYGAQVEALIRWEEKGRTCRFVENAMMSNGAGFTHGRLPATVRS